MSGNGNDAAAGNGNGDGDRLAAAGPNGPGSGGGRGQQVRFPAAFTGAVPGDKALDFRGSMGRFVRFMHPERWLMVVQVLLVAGAVSLSVLGPRLLGRATDLLFAGSVGARLPDGISKAEAVADLRDAGRGGLADLVEGMDVRPGQGIDFGAVRNVLLVVLAVYVVSGLLMFLQFRLTTVAVQRAMYRLREQAQAKLARLPLSYFDQQSRGEVLSRVTNDIDNLSQNLQQTLSQLTMALLTIVGVLVMMVLISPLLALVAVVTVPVTMVVAGQLGKRAKPQFVKQWATTGRLNGHVEEMYTGYDLVKAFGRQPEAAATFRQHNDELFAASFRAQFMSGMIQPVTLFISNLNYVLVAVVGGLQVASGTLSLGSVQAFVQYSRQFGQPVTQVASMANLLQSAAASAERVFDLLDASDQAPDPAQPAHLPPVRGRVELDHISFRYAPDVPLIDDLSLAVEPGRTVAIVGPTGAGKTTLVNLLMRFYEVTGGRIVLDGVDVATLTRDELRSKIGMVLQDTWLFEGTIADNIAYGRPGATREQVCAAAKATHVDHFVRTLPDGYDTVLGDEGNSLSAGEKQLLTIARAFLAETPILILDEATSSVDTRTELLVQQAMGRLRQGRTSFVIAHRLSTIRDADLILVMEHGSVVEQGTHDDLLAADGPYARLYRSQFTQAPAGLAAGT